MKRKMNENENAMIAMILKYSEGVATILRPNQATRWAGVIHQSLSTSYKPICDPWI